MIRLTYPYTRFLTEQSKTKAIVMEYFSFYLEKQYPTQEGCLIIREQEEKKVLKEIAKGMHSLTNMIDKKPTYFIDEEKQIPLIGTNYFGIVDRDTNILEVKPITGCNINCIFCSVDEGTLSKKTSHVVVEPRYLCQQTIALARKKKAQTHIYLNPHGEPTLYSELALLITGLRQENNIGQITMITNGVLLTKEKLDIYIQAGLSHINISINAATKSKASALAGRPYPVEKVKEMARYAATKIKVIVSPVLLQGMNEEDIETIVQWVAKENNPNLKLGIQNFLWYKRGRNPVPSMPFDRFYHLLETWELQYKIQLRDPEVWIKVVPDPVLSKPYRVGQIIEATIKAPGRFPGEYLAATKERSLVIRRSNLKIGAKVKTKIIMNKDNIYYGT
ncbi:MAG: radical SAM protein [Candidatus Woesearchaeota archaeon]